MYGVIGSTTRKLKKLYGSIGSVTKNIKKVYGVVGGVTRLIYTSDIYAPTFKGLLYARRDGTSTYSASAAFRKYIYNGSTFTLDTDYLSGNLGPLTFCNYRAVKGGHYILAYRYMETGDSGIYIILYKFNESTNTYDSVNSFHFEDNSILEELNYPYSSTRATSSEFWLSEDETMMKLIISAQLKDPDDTSNWLYQIVDCNLVIDYENNTISPHPDYPIQYKIASMPSEYSYYYYINSFYIPEIGDLNIGIYACTDGTYDATDLYNYKLCNYDSDGKLITWYSNDSGTYANNIQITNHGNYCYYGNYIYYLSGDTRTKIFTAAARIVNIYYNKYFNVFYIVTYSSSTGKNLYTLKVDNDTSITSLGYIDISSLSNYNYQTKILRITRSGLAACGISKNMYIMKFTLDSNGMITAATQLLSETSYMTNAGAQNSIIFTDPDNM